MKKTVRLLLGALLALWTTVPASAGPVGADRAASVARAFFQNDPGSRRTAEVRLVDLQLSPVTKAGAEAPAYYVFNRDGGGFVIVAGDDACKPILGYSFEGGFDTGGQMPEGLVDYLAGFESQVQHVRTHVLTADAKAAAADAWRSVEYPTKAGSGYKSDVLHKTSNWNQSDPYNRLCHKIDGWTCYVGCVPLAMGIIMNYFCHPAKGTGTLPSYTYDAWGYVDSVTGLELGHPYEWSKFHDVDFSKSYTDEQANAVSVLLRDIGVAGKAYYMPTGTDDDFWRLIPAVIEHFGYDPNVSHIKRKFYTDDEWMDMIKGDLQDHPIIYAAGQDGGGHAFVVDGYDKKDNLRINWGWKGSYNGYFALSAFTPYSGSNYKYDHTTVLGLVPDKGQGGRPEEYFFYFPAESGGVFYPGLMSSETPVRGKSFKMSAVWLCNGGITPLKGKYFFALVDNNDNIVENVSGIKDFDTVAANKYLTIWQIDCKISAYPMAGDKIKLFYRSDNWPEGVWKLPLVNNDEKRTVFEIETVPDESKIVDITSFKFDKASGNVEMKTMDRVQWSLNNSSGASVLSGVSEDMAIKFSVSGLPKGTYTLNLKRGKDSASLKLKTASK